MNPGPDAYSRITTDRCLRLALFNRCVHSSNMEKDKPKKPWGGFGYLILIVLVILVAYFIVLPIGQEISGVFQKLTNALQGKR